MIASQLGPSEMSERVLAGWDPEWAAEFASQAQGAGQTLTHEILGFGGSIAPISRLADNQALPPALTVAVAIYLGCWVVLSGGIIDRLARARPVRVAAFFSACGHNAGRLVRVALVLGLAYWGIFRWLHPWLFGTVYGAWTGEAMSETGRMAARATLYGVLLVTLALVNVTSDFAKVRLVVEDRRSALAAIPAALRFIRRRPGRVAGLYLLNALLFLAALAIWSVAAPAASSPTWLILLGGQLFLLARLWIRLGCLASEVVLFQRELAHAHYTAAPEPTWPESPAAEAISNVRVRTERG
jgi:hypothetical protein